MASSHTAFFYGTLMAPPVLYRVCYGPDDPTNTIRKNSQLTIQPALLQGFQRHRVKHADYPAIVPNPSSTVRGTLVCGLTDGDMWRLDVFEGSEYARQTVSARVIASAAAQEDHANEPSQKDLQAEAVEAETYVWIGPLHGLESREWDFEEFERDKMWRWAGQSANAEGEFDEVDDAVRQQEGEHDPTGGRGVDLSKGKKTAEESSAQGGV